MSTDQKAAARQSLWVDLLLIWIALVGLWPFVDPGHDGESLLSLVDIAIHGGALAALARRWKLVRQ